MDYIFLAFTSTFLLRISKAYDNFEGAFQQGKPCFGTIHCKDCNSSLPDVFSPPYKGVNINRQDTGLYLFTPSHPDKAEPLHKCGGRLPKNSDFDPNVDTVVIIHGWVDSMCRSAWMREIKDQLFQRGKYNVILVDWTWGNLIDLAVAGVNTLVVGEDVGFVLLNIMMEKNMNGDKFHLIGHSFGTFAANMAAKFIIQKNPEKKVRRITLLEPPSAPYKVEELQNVFSKDNAKFIDAIHTNGGTCFPTNFGAITPVGHVDFYPNGGSLQLACYPYIVSSFLKGDFLYASGSFIPQSCSHFHVLQYFKVSITHPQGLFIGAECNSYEEFESGDCKRCCKDDFSKCAVMGMDSEYFFPDSLKSEMKNRTYYLNLGVTCPYNEDYEFSVYKDC